MSQITSGIRKILSLPSVYNTLISSLGSKKLLDIYVPQYLKPIEGDRILDIGCGTSEIIDSLPPYSEYHGYDLSPEYISAAEKKYAGRGTWHCSSVMEMESDNFGTFDIVMANGLFHHLDDSEADQLAAIASLSLKPGGRFCSLDNCYVYAQNPIARFLISRDRGQNVREPEGYEALISPHFDSVELFIRHDLLRVPYTHAIVVATKA